MRRFPPPNMHHCQHPIWRDWYAVGAPYGPTVTRLATCWAAEQWCMVCRLHAQHGVSGYPSPEICCLQFGLLPLAGRVAVVKFCCTACCTSSKLSHLTSQHNGPLPAPWTFACTLCISHLLIHTPPGTVTAPAVSRGSSSFTQLCAPGVHLAVDTLLHTHLYRGGNT